jgi:hypothetical protein
VTRPTLPASRHSDLPKGRAISEVTEVLDESATAAVQSSQGLDPDHRGSAAPSRVVLAADPDAANRRHRAGTGITAATVVPTGRRELTGCAQPAAGRGLYGS